MRRVRGVVGRKRVGRAHRFDARRKLPRYSERVPSGESGLRENEVELSSRYHGERPVELGCRRALELDRSASQLWIDEACDGGLQRVLGVCPDIRVADPHFLALIYTG